MVQDNSKKRYDAFICYETTTANHFASNLKKSLKRMGKEAFVASKDIIAGEDEEDKRYFVIQDSPDFIIIMTYNGLQSQEVKKEIDKAVELDKNIIVCLDTKIEKRDFISYFPKLARKQRITFTDKYDLANIVTSLYSIKKAEVAPTAIGIPKEYMIMINSYILIPIGGKEINIGDTLKFRNLEASRQVRVLVNENGIWEEEQYLSYMRYVSYTFNEPGMYTFYLKGRESKKWIVTVK